MKEPIKNLELIKKMSKQNPTQLLDAFVNGKIWENENIITRDSVNIKSAWQKESQDALFVADCKLERSLQLWQTGHT